MDKHKLEKLASLEGEVKGFHPVLDVLFRRLPGITAVEYRQGANEKGADFVLTKRDDTLGSQDYIGVIVKVGSIKQGHQDVERQIAECEMARVIEGGKRTIVLNEVWVVSNDTITVNAQEVIHHKYSNKNIKFLSGEKVCGLIDSFYPQYWTDVSVAVGEYLREVEAKSKNMTFGTGMLATQSVKTVTQNFIRSQSISRNFGHGKKKDIKQNLRILSASNQFLFIEGMMGLGKSTALGHLARDLSSSDSFNEHRIVPILLSVKEALSDFDCDVAAIVRNVRDRVGEVPDNTKYLVMLDALDELDLSSEERVELVNKLHAGAQSSGAQLILTSRDLSDPVMEKEVEKRFERYRLTQLSIAQVIGLVDQVCQNVLTKQRLTKDLEKSRLFRSLPRTPISAILLAKILDENTQEIPSTMTELYAKYMELVLGRWDMSKSLQSQMEYDVISSVSTMIAKMMMDHSLDRLAMGDVRELCIEYINGRNLKVNCEVVIAKMLQKRELFFISPTDGALSFNHRTFAEYFYAAGLNREGANSITDKVYDPYWITTYFFYFGLRRDAPELVEMLDGVELSDDVAKLFKISHHAGFLLAAYLTPYSRIQASMRIALQQTADFYREIHLNEETKLAGFSEIQLLCITTQAVCSAYGYDYFKPALQEIATELYSDPSPEGKLLELFFVNSAIASMSDGAAFDTMIKDYGPSIPLPLQLGIISHSEDVKIHSDVLDKYMKNFHKKQKTNAGLKESIYKLFHDPISNKTKKKLAAKV